MPQRIRFVAVVMLSLAGLIVRADEADDAKEELRKAKQSYESEVEKLKKAVAEFLDKREETYRKQGDRKLLDEVKAQRKAFEGGGDLPPAFPVGVQRFAVEARSAVDRTYRAAVKAHIRVKKDGEADTLEKDRGKFLYGTAPVAGKRTYLGNLKPFGVRAWNNFFDKDSDKFRLDDQVVPHSVLMHPEYQGEAIANYTISAAAILFRATVGIPRYKGNASDPHSPVTFEVLADGKSVWQSEAVTKLDTFQTCAVRLEAVKKLTLRVSCVREHGQAHAVWFAPVVIE